MAENVTPRPMPVTEMPDRKSPTDQRNYGDDLVAGIKNDGWKCWNTPWVVPSKPDGGTLK